jgi:isopenicillin N synthase-like dioxygenase
MPSKTHEKNAPDRDSFAVGSDFTDSGQHFIRQARPGSVSQNQWPDEEVPEFRKVFYQYCEFLQRFRTSKLLIIDNL